MAEPESTQAVPIDELDKFAARLTEMMSDPKRLGRVERAIGNGMQVAIVNVVGALLNSAGALGAFLANLLLEGETFAAPAYAKLMNTAIKDITGVDVSGASAQPGDRGSRTESSRRIGKALLDVIAGSGNGGAGSEIVPSSAGAEQYLTFVTQMALEGWLQDILGELVSLGFIEQLGDLDDALAQVLGLGRMSRRVVAPLLNARVIAPFQWRVNKTYSPELLSVSAAARQITRGRGNREQWMEDIRRQGYNEERIEALLNEQAKFHSPADLDLLVRARQLDHSAAVQHLRDQGYDQPIAETELRLERLKRIASFERTLASAAVNAYADFRIDELALDEATHGATIDDQEGAQFRELAKARRAFRRRPVSEGDAEAAVKAGIWAFIGYRAFLRQEGYTEDAILTKELLLRHEIDREAKIEELRAKAEEERRLEREQREQEKKARKEEVERERALRRRGPLSLLERAAVRGLISFARVEEILAPEYDADTVAIFLEDIEADRQAYLAELARAEAARQRGLRRDLDVGTLEQAVLAGQLTLGDFARHPMVQKFDEPDRVILIKTLTQRVADQEAAKKKREEAEREATRRQIDLGRFEQLVLRGVRTMAQYAALLRTLGFDDGSIAAIQELLILRIAEAADERKIRQEEERRLQMKGLSLDQFRRGVLLGVKTIDQFETFLTAEHVTTDAQVVLLAALRADLAEAEAARRRREEHERQLGTLALGLASVRRAAQLGVITPGAYRTRLAAAGLAPDDIAIEMELLLIEIGEIQARRRMRESLEVEAAAKGLSLADVEHAVKAGLATVADYEARAITLGYGKADVTQLVELLEQEIAGGTG